MQKAAHGTSSSSAPARLKMDITPGTFSAELPAQNIHGGAVTLKVKE